MLFQQPASAAVTGRSVQRFHTAAGYARRSSPSGLNARLLVAIFSSLAQADGYARQSATPPLQRIDVCNGFVTRSRHRAVRICAPAAGSVPIPNHGSGEATRTPHASAIDARARFAKSNQFLTPIPIGTNQLRQFLLQQKVIFTSRKCFR